MNLLLENASQIVTCHTNGHLFKAGKFQSELGLIKNTYVYTEGGKIHWVGNKIPPSIRRRVRKTINCKGRVVTPGFIDSHTHMVFSGSRASEYSMRIAGKSYEEIAIAGGGIKSTVKSVRRSSKAELESLALKRLKTSLSYGVTTIEIKSGYGLDTLNEMKMLEVINEIRKKSAIDVYPTFLGAHAVPDDCSKDEYIRIITRDMIPMISSRNLAVFTDVFCERSYFTAKEAEMILSCGKKYGLIPKLHTNQFSSIGGIRTALRCNAISVDHLEVMTKREIGQLSGKGIVACLLPSVSYFLDIPYAPARELIDNGIPVALATDFNPGSSMTQNIQLILSMGVHLLKMNIAEALNAVTINAAAALGISHITGSIECGKDADLLVFDTSDYRDIVYNLGINLISSVIKRGKIIYKSNHQ